MRHKKYKIHNYVYLFAYVFLCFFFLNRTNNHFSWQVLQRCTLVMKISLVEIRFCIGVGGCCLNYVPFVFCKFPTRTFLYFWHITPLSSSTLPNTAYHGKCQALHTRVIKRLFNLFEYEIYIGPISRTHYTMQFDHVAF